MDETISYLIRDSDTVLIPAHDFMQPLRYHISKTGTYSLPSSKPGAEDLLSVKGWEVDKINQPMQRALLRG